MTDVTRDAQVVAIKLPGMGSEVPAGRVTRRQFELLYAHKGWVIVDENPPATVPSVGTAENEAPAGSDGAGSYTEE